MSTNDWDAFIVQTNKRMASLRKAIPDVAEGFGEVATYAIGKGALTPKIKELMALAIGITVRCDGCVAYHVKAAMGYGATREELAETVGVAVYMGGGPSMIYGAEALAAYDAFASEDK